MENARFAALRERIRSELLETGVPSLALAVARAGHIVWEEGFGWASREGRVPATPHTLYALASISKPITATGLMVLKERGLIDLDRPADHYLGAARLKAWIGRAEDATVRRLANHTAGLPLHYHFFFSDEPFRPPSMDETIRRYANLVTPPGETYRYANLGYGILGHILSRCSGKSCADFLREEVFLPLDMPHASFGIGPGLEPYCAIRYAPNGTPLPFYDFDHPGASAVFCSAHDLVRFGLFHLKAHMPDQKPILSDAAIDEMQVPTAEIDGGTGYGIGWHIMPDDGGWRTVRHDGNMGGVRTRLVLVPSEDLAVAVLSNANNDLPLGIAAEVLSALLPGYAERRAQQQAERAKTRPAPVPFRPSPDLLGAWAGRVHTFRENLPLTLEFHEDGDVHARLGDDLETLLNDPRFENGRLTGRMAGDIGTEDARRTPHVLHLDLKHRENVLNGSVSALTRPGQRFGNALSHWAEVRKQA